MHEWGYRRQRDSRGRFRLRLVTIAWRAFDDWVASQNKTAGLGASSPAEVLSAAWSITIPTTFIPVIIAIPASAPTAIPTPIMAMVMNGRQDHHGPRPVSGRSPDHGRRAVRPGNGHHHRGEHRPGYEDHRWRAHGRRRRTHYARWRREAEGDAEVEVRPRRRGDCESQGEGTDSDHGFGFHNGSFDEAPLRRFGFSPLIELIRASGVGNSEGRRLPSGNCGAADRSVYPEPFSEAQEAAETGLELCGRGKAGRHAPFSERPAGM